MAPDKLEARRAARLGLAGTVCDVAVLVATTTWRVKRNARRTALRTP
jgi:hypothetical protein